MSGPAEGAWFDRISAFAGATAAVILVGGWAFGEAIVLPVVPDVALALLALAVLTGAAPGQVDAMLRALPAIDGGTMAAVDAELAEEGVAGFAQFGPGPPLKAYTVSWVEAGGGMLSLLAGVVLNRVTRIGPVVLIAALAGWLVPSWLRKHERVVIPAYVVAWTAFYALYWARW
jgi:hypothetical protein